MKSGDGQHVDEARRGVAIAHLGGNLPLVGNEERSGQRRVLTKDLVDRTPGARPDSCE